MFYGAKIGDTKLAGNVAGVEALLARELDSSDAAKRMSFVPGASFEGVSGGVYNLTAANFATLFARALKAYKYVDIAGAAADIATGTSFAGVRMESVEFDVPTTNASFAGSVIADTNFKKDATGASFAGASIARSAFGYGIDMTGASFAGAKLNESGDAGDTVIFDSVNLKNALFNGGATRINNTYFNGAQLAGAKFGAARLENVDFGTAAILTDAVFDGANLKGVAIGANFNMAKDPLDSSSKAASFKNASIDGLALGHGAYGAADFTGAMGKGLLIAGNSDLSDAIFESVNLTDWLRLSGGRMPANMKYLAAQGLELDSVMAAASGTDISGISLESLDVARFSDAANLTVAYGKGNCTNYRGKISDYNTYWSATLVNFANGDRNWIVAAPAANGIFIAAVQNMYMLGLAKGS
jgi:uncharacterized protein YjbI with pentapeptide repeats